MANPWVPPFLSEWQRLTAWASPCFGCCPARHAPEPKPQHAPRRRVAEGNFAPNRRRRRSCRTAGRHRRRLAARPACKALAARRGGRLCTWAGPQPRKRQGSRPGALPEPAGCRQRRTLPAARPAETARLPAPGYTWPEPAAAGHRPRRAPAPHRSPVPPPARPAAKKCGQTSRESNRKYGWPCLKVSGGGEFGRNHPRRPRGLWAIVAGCRA
jgi:hypothetical protein